MPEIDDVQYLAPQHRAKLLSSGIDPDGPIARARGYATIEDPDDPRLAPFAPVQRNVPLLLIPSYDVHGFQTSGQVRPDTPRIAHSSGKPLRYESPKGGAAFVDVNPIVRERVTRTAEPLVITEGCLKADSAIGQGILTVAIPGVFSWRSKMIGEASAAIPDFESIPMVARTVILCYDADVTTKDSVRLALRRLVGHLRTFHAELQIAILPKVNDDPKTGLDDWLAAGGTKAELFGELARPADDVLKELDQETVARTTRSRDDLGNAYRLIDHYPDRIRVCPNTGWYVFDGRVWQREAKFIVEGWATGLKSLVLEDRATLQKVGVGGFELKFWTRWATASAMVGRVNAATDMLEKLPEVHGDWQDFDRRPDLLTVGNGTLELNADGTVTLRPSKQDDLLSLATNTPYDPFASAPLFESIVKRALPDPEVRAYVQRLAGAALLGSNAGQRVNIWYGTGANSKSTILYAWKTALGNGLNVEVDPKSLQSNSRAGSSPSPDLMRLRGARLVTAVEAADRLDTELLKRVSGGEEIVARQLFGKPIAFAPAFDLILSCNNPPEFADRSDGLWRRVVVVPFDVTIPVEDRIDQMEMQRRLDAEAPGILRWMVDGYGMFREEGGLNPPDQIKVTSQRLRDQSDWLASFFETENYGPVEKGFLKAKDVWETFTAYRMGDSSLRNMSRAKLLAEVERKCGPRVRDNRQGLGWRGWGVQIEEVSKVMETPTPVPVFSRRTGVSTPLTPSEAPKPSLTSPESLSKALSGDQMGWLRNTLPSPEAPYCRHCHRPMVKVSPTNRHQCECADRVPIEAELSEHRNGRWGEEDA